jgi:hypothetical protein
MQQTMTKPVTATATGTIALAGNVLNMTNLLLALQAGPDFDSPG